MKRKKNTNFLKILVFSLISILLVACGNGEKPEPESKQEGILNVVSTFSILSDMVEEIGGDYVQVHNLVPIGTDPHDYEPLPEDIKAATDADLLFYNGLNLEGGDRGWFFRLVDSVGQPEDHVYKASEGIEPMYLADEEGNQEVNPHAFISPKAGIQMTENIRNALIERLPEQKDYFQEQADKYLNQLENIDQDYTEKIGEIPEEDRVFIASEEAFQYMTAEYGLKEGYIWAIDTDENGTPDQIKSTINFVKENQPNVLFVESNVDRRPMQTVSAETNVDIYERPIYSDEIGKSGEEGDTYIKYLEYNLDVIYNGLKK